MVAFLAGVFANCYSSVRRDARSYDAGKNWGRRLLGCRFRQALRPIKITVPALFIVRGVEPNLAQRRKGFPYGAEALPDDLVIGPAVDDDRFRQAALSLFQATLRLRRHSLFRLLGERNPLDFAGE